MHLMPLKKKTFCLCHILFMSVRNSSEVNIKQFINELEHVLKKRDMYKCKFLEMYSKRKI